jgi:hypothetical protein
MNMIVVVIVLIIIAIIVTIAPLCECTICARNVGLINTKLYESNLGEDSGVRSTYTVCKRCIKKHNITNYADTHNIKKS